MKNNLYPIFTTHYSIGKSILTADSPEEILETSPVSVFSIAKTHKLDTIYILDDNFSGYVELYKNACDNKIKLCFGLQLIICHDINDKSEESFKTESKVNLWILNLQGYKDILKIYTKAATDGYYYIPRIDWKSLNELLTNNIAVSIPFYDSFLYNNNFKGGNCIPIIPKNTKFHIEKHELPFDNILQQMVEKYIDINKFEAIESSQCYYYNKSDIDAYTVFRCATSNSFGKKQLITEPQIDHFGSNCFCFEHYLNLCQNQ